MDEKAEQVKALIEEMVELVPAEGSAGGRLEGTPVMLVPHTLRTAVSRAYRVWAYDTWPYDRIDVNGLTVGFVTSSHENRDYAGISWPANTAEGIESRSRHIPPVELDAVQEETYRRLREDGVDVDRAAALSLELHPST